MKFPLIGVWHDKRNTIITQAIKCRYEVYCLVLSFLLFLPNLCSSACRRFKYIYEVSSIHVKSYRSDVALSLSPFAYALLLTDKVER